MEYICLVQTRSYVKNTALDAIISLHEPYQSFSSVFISNFLLGLERGDNDNRLVT